MTIFTDFISNVAFAVEEDLERMKEYHYKRRQNG